VPWLVSRDSEQLGYSVGAKWYVTGEDHRNQTRYLFAYIFFRVVNQVFHDIPKIDMATRHKLYEQINRLREHHESSPSDTSPYRKLLEMADGVVATYMELAKTQSWYVDRNSFLKQSELLNESHLVMASTGPLLGRAALARQAQEALAG